jgi:ParB family chromosome partitioning protein
MKRKRPTDDMFKKALDQSIPTTKDKLRFGVDETQSILAELPIESIIVDKQVRSHFDEAEIESLAKSIEQVGLQQPVKVSLVDPVFKKYKLIVGERRLRAFIYLGKSTIPAFIGKTMHKTNILCSYMKTYTVKIYILLKKHLVL